LRALKPKVVLLMMLIFFALTLRPAASASVPDQPRVYEYALYNLAVLVNSSIEAYPGQNMTVSIAANASAGLTVNYTAIQFYTFNNSTMVDENFSLVVWIDYNSSMFLSSGQTSNVTSYNVTIPDYASNVVYGKLTLVWTEKGTEESNVYARESTFIVTSLNSPELEKLRSEVPELQKENADLKNNITEMSNTLAEALNNITQINNTLTQALNNLTDTQNRYEGEASGTRSVIAILAVTTVFFVGTTLYLVLRKPRQYW
jgi:hypothetical protein